ncbi:AAA family ATPase [Lapidilactobacillus wuchangensis]|uniref:AAA family ATPase n=1 Tax=Lapidilactobacillus wuchangensis TaxID=2486001 RepID=UPI000F76CDEB|nr:AAA family ATPase [Lapidilactobacillus wuchangensis]
MRIEQLNLIDFGMFHQFELKLDPSAQLIYGDNEQGKTTLLSFMLLMLYGDQGRDRKGQLTIRSKYQPWSGREMAGSLILTAKNHRYQIEKHFGKTFSKDTTEIIDLNTDEAVPLPPKMEVGEWLLDLNLAGFLKTGFIGQPGIFNNGQGQDDLTEKLVKNLTQSGDETVSANEVLARLAAASTDLRSKSGNKGQLVAAKDQLEQLQLARQATVARQTAQTEQVAQLQELSQQRQQRDQLQTKLQQDQQAQQSQQRQQLLQAIQANEQQIQALHALSFQPEQVPTILPKLQQLVQDAVAANQAAAVLTKVNGQNLSLPISEADYAATAKLQQQTEKIQQLQNFFQQELDPAAAQALQQQAAWRELTQQQKQLTEQLAPADQLRAQAEQLTTAQQQNLQQQQIHQDRLDRSQQHTAANSRTAQQAHKNNQQQKLLLGGGLLLLGIGLILVIVKIVFGYVLAGGGLLLAVISLLRRSTPNSLVSDADDFSEQKAALQELQAQALVLQQQAADLAPQLNQLKVTEQQLQQVVHQIQAAQPRLATAWDRWNTNLEQWQTQLANTDLQLPELTLATAALTELKNQLSLQLANCQQQLIQQLHAKQVADFTTYQVNYQLQQKDQVQQQQWHDLQKRQQTTQAALLAYYQQLGHTEVTNLTQAQQELATLTRVGQLYQTTQATVASQRQVTGIKASSAELAASLQQATTAARLTTEQRHQLQTQLKQFPTDLDDQWYQLQHQLQGFGRSVDEIDHDIHDLIETVNLLQTRYQSLTLAQTTLQQVIDERRKYFAPSLKEKAGQYLATLTNQRYQELLIPKSFALEVRDQGSYHEADYLSSGTADQAYLALRLAITNLLTNKAGQSSLPLLLDDILREYDDTRAANAFRFLKSQSQQHQLIMFTCHQNLADLAAKNGFVVRTL